MKSQLQNVQEHGIKYTALAFICPGCQEMFNATGLHMLPVNTTLKKASWAWNGSTEKPTLTPSILTRTEDGGVCHSFLRDGVFQFLDDCTHSLAGLKIPMPDLPDWFTDE